MRKAASRRLCSQSANATNVAGSTAAHTQLQLDQAVAVAPQAQVQECWECFSSGGVLSAYYDLCPPCRNLWLVQHPASFQASGQPQSHTPPDCE